MTPVEQRGTEGVSVGRDGTHTTARRTTAPASRRALGRAHVALAVAAVASTAATSTCGPGASAASAAARRPPLAGAPCSAAELGSVARTDQGTLVCRRDGSGRRWVGAAAATTSTVPAPPLPSGRQTVVFRDDFAALGGGWATGATDAGSVGYRDEKFRITVTAPATAMGARAPLAQSIGNVGVEVDVRTVSTTGQVSLGCYDSGATETPNRYDALIGRDDRWSIAELRGGIRTPLAGGELALGAQYTGERPNRLAVTCTGSPGAPGRVRLWLNGRLVGEAIVAAMLPPGGVSLWASSYATPTINGTTSVETTWNDLVVSRFG